MSEHQTEPADWRPIVAALNNPYSRRVYAQVVLGQETDDLGAGLSPARRRHVLDSLVKAGLIRFDGQDYRESSEVFTTLLAGIPRAARRTGPERFLNGRGEIDRYPTDVAELRGLLTFIADQVLTGGQVLAEPELNERLARFSADTAGLRRHLVDAEVLERTRSGSRYSRVVQPVDDQASADPSR